MTICKCNRLQPKRTWDFTSALMRGTETRLFIAHFRHTLYPLLADFTTTILYENNSRMCQVSPLPYHGPFTRHMGPMHTQIRWALRMHSPELSIPMKRCNNLRATYTPHKIWAFSGSYAVAQTSIALQWPCTLHPFILNACYKKHVSVSQL
jgi:hypothetical protein